MAAVAVAWRSSVVWLCVLLSVLSVSPWLLVAVSGQSACLATANQYFLGSTSGAVQVISPVAAFDLTGQSPTAGPGNMIDNNLYTQWVPGTNSQNNYGAYFQFAADGLSTAYLVVGYSITVYTTTGPSFAYSFRVGISQQATDNINQTQEVATVNVPQTTTSTAMTYYVWVKNPFISDGASLVGVWSATLATQPQAKVAEVRFFVVPVIPLTGSSDPQGHPGCYPLQNVQSTIDGTGLSFWNPGCGGSATYVESLSTYSRSGQYFSFNGVLLQTIYDGAHSPTSFSITTSGLPTVPWNVVNYGLSPAYGVYISPEVVSLSYGATASVQYTMAQDQPYIRQIAIIGTGTPLPSLLPVYSPGCIWSNSSIQQFYARYNAAVGVMTHTLAWDQTDTDNLFNFWLTKPIQLHLIPACFPYPYLPYADTTAATLFSEVAPGSAPTDHQWTISSPSGLDQAWGVGCNTCSGTQLSMYNYLNSFVEARNAITGSLQRDLSNYWNTYYTNRLADINAITDFFDGPNTQFNINTFVLIQKELNTLASAKDSPLGIITDVLGVIGAALPGLGVVFSSFADVATGVAAAVSTASTLSTLGQDIASGSGLSGGSPITTPFDALGGAGYLMSPIACQSGACTNDLYFGQMLQEVTAQSTAGAESVTPFVQRVLANYGQTMFFNAWYQGYTTGSPLYPTSVLNSLLQNEASTSASWQAALGVRAMQNAFSFNTSTNSQNVQVCYLLSLQSGYPDWSNSAWNGLRSVFSSSPLKSTFWLSSPPVQVSGGCPGASDSPPTCYANCNQGTINQLLNQIVPNALVAGADPLFQSSIGAPAATTAQTQQCTYS